MLSFTAFEASFNSSHLRNSPNPRICRFLWQLRSKRRVHSSERDRTGNSSCPNRHRVPVARKHGATGRVGAFGFPPLISSGWRKESRKRHERQRDIQNEEHASSVFAASVSRRVIPAGKPRPARPRETEDAAFCKMDWKPIGIEGKFTGIDGKRLTRVPQSKNR